MPRTSLEQTQMILKFRQRALNRGEAFNRLYQAIAILNKGQLRGHLEVDMMIWDACTRLLAAVILYYNSDILLKIQRICSDYTSINLFGKTTIGGSHVMLCYVKFTVLKNHYYGYPDM